MQNYALRKESAIAFLGKFVSTHHRRKYLIVMINYDAQVFHFKSNDKNFHNPEYMELPKHKQNDIVLTILPFSFFPQAYGATDKYEKK